VEETKAGDFRDVLLLVHWSGIVNIALSCTIFGLFDVEYYRDLEIGVRGHSRSMKLVPFKSLSTVSYSPFIVTMALSCIVCDSDLLVENPEIYISHIYLVPSQGVIPWEFREDV